ncbi:MAG TPA: chemotaxis protein CheB [Cyclobacteriaceae bacterium]|nr:chemotaxis protein CheB [Cyclobacteriaceae bacterium]
MDKKAEKGVPKKGKALLKSSNLFPVVGVGASAGGLDAFKRLLKAIPEKSGIAWVLVQHLDPTHESLLPALLQKVTDVPVLEISDDIKVAADHIYIIPSNKMLVANNGVLQISPRPDTGQYHKNLPIDLFFASLAEVHQAHSIGIVLSGTASDGTLGLKAIKDHGGITFAQDEESSQYGEMPRNAVAAGVVDFVLPPESIPEKILAVTNVLNETRISTHKIDIIKQILSLIRTRKGVDFTHYKQPTLNRRILRRMTLLRMEEPTDYLDYLRTNAPEQEILHRDLLIPVTAFFRDPDIFDGLIENVFPQILENKTEDQTLRVWVAGCSTGEEAFSMGICIAECLGNWKGKVQIFATDIREAAIAKSRSGLYSKDEVGGVSPRRLREFFSQVDGSYLIRKDVRDMCVFAVHNFLKDPPFSKMDFISCRNVLIYMEPYLQSKVLGAFHHALNPGGILLLGKSETTNSARELFTPSRKVDNTFLRKDVSRTFMNVTGWYPEQNVRDKKEDPGSQTVHNDYQESAREIIMDRYTPSGIVVNEAMEVVYFHGDNGAWLQLSSGKPTHSLLKLARPDVAFELRSLLQKVKKTGESAIRENVALTVNGNQHLASLEVVPLPDVTEPHYLVLFRNNALSGSKKPSLQRKTRLVKDEQELRIRQLEQELAQTRDEMRSIIEGQEVANEELQSANEELQSGSEELQSLNEEMETAKEELQSANEELTVVNQELTALNEQVVGERNYSEALVATIRSPMLVLGMDFRIRSANNAFYRAFRVNAKETEGRLLYELGNNQWDIPQLRSFFNDVLHSRESIFDFEISHQFASIGQRTMLLNAREVVRVDAAEKLILLAIEDITERKNAEDVLKISEAHFRQLAEMTPGRVTAADALGIIYYYNKSWTDYTGLSLEELLKTGLDEFVHPDDMEELVRRRMNSIATGSPFEMEWRIKNKNGEYLWHLCRSVPVKDGTGRIVKWIGSATEIQQQKEHEEVLEMAVDERTAELKSKNEDLQKVNSELEAFAYVTSHDLQEPLRKIQTFASRILAEDIPTKIRSDFDRIRGSALRMQTLIRDLIFFSRTTQSEKIFVRKDVSAILEAVKNDFREIVDEKLAIIETEGTLHEASVIPFQFHQLLYNLIGNALKFSDPERPPHIIIKGEIAQASDLEKKNPALAIQNDGILVAGKAYYHLSISDNGIGFELLYRDKIFEMFQKLSERETSQGTGIGLAIVKRIVANHKGVITASGEPNRGATFDIYIPDF